MELKQLEYFVRVAELGSFTRAAQALSIAQPALSRQVRQLEVELRSNLLVRNGRGALPTDAGRLLLDHARGILHQVALAREELGRVHGALAGRVALGLPPSIARALTVELTRAARKQLPHAVLSISEGLSVPMQESLRTGRLDIALLYDPAPAPEIETQPLMEDALYLISRRIGTRTRGSAARNDGPPIALKEVAALPLVMPARPNAIRMRVEGQMAAAGCKPLIALEVDAVAAILDLVADGAGSAVLPRYAVAGSANPRAFVVRAIVRPRLQSRLAIATSSRRTVTQTQQAMVRLLTAVARAVLEPPVRGK